MSDSVDARLQSDVLVLAFGNEWRGDDAAGIHLGQAIEAMRIPGVRVRICRQPTPELAAEIALARVVVFADASVSGPPGSAGLSEISRSRRFAIFDHALSPSDLLDLCEIAFGARPHAYLLRIHVSDCGFGDEPSLEARDATLRALEIFKNFCRTLNLQVHNDTAEFGGNHRKPES
ncbi:MAG: hydrogenase maturation protease [Verrucomicrobiae bacterium]|nr:hydrogenase maturation protease [Verrucomicrobiae bacterium]